MHPETPPFLWLPKYGHNKEFFSVRFLKKKRKKETDGVGYAQKKRKGLLRALVLLITMTEKSCDKVI